MSEHCIRHVENCAFCGGTHDHKVGVSYSCGPPGIGYFRPEVAREIRAMSQAAQDAILGHIVDQHEFADLLIGKCNESIEGKAFG